MWESDSQLAHSLNAMPARGCLENVCLCINVKNRFYFSVFVLFPV